MNRYYSPEDEAQMAAAETFEQLLRVAFDVIERMPEPVGMVTGPITTGGLGSIEANVEELRRHIQRLMDRGEAIFNQLPMEPHMWRIMKTPYYCGDDHLLEAFYGGLFDSGLLKKIFQIPGWESSYGARWEWRRALKLRLTIVPLERLS